MISRSVFSIQLGDGRLIASADRAGRQIWSQELHFQGEVELSQALAGLAEPVHHQRLPRRTVVRVEPPLLQQRLLSDVPPVNQAELAQLVARATPRYFRQNGHALVSAVRWENGQGSPARIARAVALDLPLAEAVVEGVRRAGLKLSDILPQGSESSLSLLPPTERAQREASARVGLAKLAGLTVMLWLAVGVFLWARLRVESSRIDQELARLSEPRKALIAARQAMDSAADMVLAVDQAQRNRPELPNRLAMIVSRLPDSTFLTGITIDRSGSILLSGRSRNVQYLVKSLRPGDRREVVQLDGVTTRDTVGGIEWERFSLTINPEPEP